jgi:hypothetical protein
VRTALIVALGLVLGVGGCGVFLHSVDQADALAHKGVRVEATIERAHNRSRLTYTPDRTEGRLRVAYVAHGRVERNVRVWLPEGTDYRAGQRVEIAYDRKDPRHAVLAKGGDPGPIALISFFVFVAGLCVFYVLWKSRRTGDGTS